MPCSKKQWLWNFVLPADLTFQTFTGPLSFDSLKLFRKINGLRNLGRQFPIAAVAFFRIWCADGLNVTVAIMYDIHIIPNTPVLGMADSCLFLISGSSSGKFFHLDFTHFPRKAQKFYTMKVINTASWLSWCVSGWVLYFPLSARSQSCGYAIMFQSGGNLPCDQIWPH